MFLSRPGTRAPTKLMNIFGAASSRTLEGHCLLRPIIVQRGTDFDQQEETWAEAHTNLVHVLCQRLVQPGPKRIQNTLPVPACTSRPIPLTLSPYVHSTQPRCTPAPMS
ncbi:unnamed protein product, partial [Ectocarpus sp. 6 AP-2014]